MKMLDYQLEKKNLAHIAFTKDNCRYIAHLLYTIYLIREEKVPLYSIGIRIRYSKTEDRLNPFPGKHNTMCKWRGEESRGEQQLQKRSISKWAHFFW